MEHEARRRSTFGSLCLLVTNRSLDALHETQAGLDLFYDHSGSKGGEGGLQAGAGAGKYKQNQTVSRENRRMSVLFSKLHALGLNRFDMMDLVLGRLERSVGRALRKTLHPGMSGIHLCPVDAVALQRAGVAHRRGEIALSAVGGTRPHLPCVFSAKTSALVAPSSGTNYLLALALALNAVIVIHRHEQPQQQPPLYAYVSEADDVRDTAVAAAYDDFLVLFISNS
jgi:hypothetical protein